jgi:5-hydroxyisourate hydrolase-like protein (transthyretin family)
LTLLRRAGDRYETVKAVTTNSDTAALTPLLGADALLPGRYKLR